jgi:hypothetical protein
MFQEKQYSKILVFFPPLNIYFCSTHPLLPQTVIIAEKGNTAINSIIVGNTL